MEVEGGHCVGNPGRPGEGKAEGETSRCLVQLPVFMVGTQSPLIIICDALPSFGRSYLFI